MCQWGHCLSPVAGFEPASTKCPKALSPSSLQMCAVYVWIISNSIHQRIEADTCIPQQFVLVLPPLLSSVKQCVQRYVGVIKTLLCETSWNKAVPPASAMRSPRTTDPVGIFSSSLRRANSAWSLTKLGHRTPQRFWHFDCYPCIESCRVISRMTKPILTCFDLRAWCFFQYIVGMLEDCNMMHMSPDFLQPQRHLSNLLFQVGAVGGNLAKNYREHLETTI